MSFTAVVFATANRWKRPKRSSTKNRGMDKQEVGDTQQNSSEPQKSWHNMHEP